MNNMNLRLEMAKTGMKQWQVAELIGITEQAFSKKLRRELSPEEQERIIEMIRNRAVG